MSEQKKNATPAGVREEIVLGPVEVERLKAEAKKEVVPASDRDGRNGFVRSKKLRNQCAT